MSVVFVYSVLAIMLLGLFYLINYSLKPDID